MKSGPNDVRTQAQVCAVELIARLKQVPHDVALPDIGPRHGLDVGAEVNALGQIEVAKADQSEKLRSGTVVEGPGPRM